VKGFDHYIDDLTTYAGTRKDQLYFIGVNFEEGYNVVIITVYIDWDF